MDSVLGTTVSNPVEDTMLENLHYLQAERKHTCSKEHIYVHAYTN
jgi:hypothetical protein